MKNSIHPSLKKPTRKTDVARSIGAEARVLAQQLNKGGNVTMLLEMVALEDRILIRQALGPLLKRETIQRIANDPYIICAGKFWNNSSKPSQDKGFLWSSSLWAEDSYKLAPGRAWVMKIWWDAMNRDFEPIEMHQTIEILMKRKKPERVFQADSLQQQLVARNQAWTITPSSIENQSAQWVEGRPRNSPYDDAPENDNELWARCELRTEQANVIFHLMEQRNKIWAKTSYDLIEDFWGETQNSLNENQEDIREIRITAPVAFLPKNVKFTWLPDANRKIWIENFDNDETYESNEKRQENSALIHVGPRKTTSPVVFIAMTWPQYAMTRRWSALAVLARSANRQPKGDGLKQHMAFLEKHRALIEQDLGAGGCERAKKKIWRHWIHQLVVSLQNVKKYAPPIALIDALRQTCPSQEDYQWSTQKIGEFLATVFDAGGPDSGWLVPTRDWISGWTDRRPNLESAKNQAEKSIDETWSDCSVENLRVLAKSIMSSLVVPEVWSLPEEDHRKIWIEQKQLQMPSIISAVKNGPAWLETAWVNSVISRTGSLEHFINLSIEKFKGGEKGWGTYLNDLIEAEAIGVVNLRRASDTSANFWNKSRAMYEREILKLSGENTPEATQGKRRTRTI
jgi:hypothetical protein